MSASRRRYRFTFRALLYLPLFVLLSLAGAADGMAAGPAVERQTVSVTLKPEEHLVVGESELTFAPGTETVLLRLSETAQVEYVEVSGERTRFSFKDGVLLVQLPGSSHAATVKVSYRAAFNDKVSSSPAAEDPSYGVNAAITREGTFLGDGSLWYPVPKQVPARRSVAIAAPAGIEALTYGKRISRGTVGAVTRSVWEEAHPVGVLSLCAGPYRIEERRVNGIDLYSYLYPDNASLAPRYLDAAAKYLKFYSDLFGPFPFEKFAVVENFFPTGYGFPSFTLLGGSVIRLPFIVDTSFPHEIAHSWWGNGVEVDLRQGNWCEGLVSYLADYYLKEVKSPAEARDHRRQLLIDYASLVTAENDFPLVQFTSRVDPASRAIGYGKAAMVFHMIRSRIGDRAFFEALRQVARDHLYRSASWNDLIRAFSGSSGEDLLPFAEQWLTRRGAPRLALAGVTETKEGGKTVVSGAVVQPSPPFQVPVPLRLVTGGAPVQASVPVASEKTGFRMSSAAVPKRLVLDPDAQIFRLLTPQEIPATINSIKGSRSVLGVITDGCKAGRGSFGTLLSSLSHGDAPVVREADLAGIDVSRLDLVFCGLPQEQGGLLPLPDEVEVSERGISVEGEAFSAPDALLVLVLKRKDAPGQVAALFHPLSEPAAAQYLGKITHYGKYGLLVFARGANRRKGTVGGADGGVAVELRH